MRSTVTLNSIAFAHRPVVFFTPSMIGMTLCLLIGMLFGFLMTHGLVHPYDKVVHLVFFAGFLFFSSTSIQAMPFLPALAVISLALGSEFLQGMIPGRNFSIGDIIANSSGCLIGLGLLSYRERYTAFCARSPFFNA